MKQRTDYHHILARIVADPRYQRNLTWGDPRPGHPEGAVRAHIAELELNLQQLRPRIDDSSNERLQILIHVHDTFKADAKEGVAIRDPRSHASLASSFLSEFCEDADLIAMVQNHDEPYALWKQRQAKGTYDLERYRQLVETIQDWNLFLTFLVVDGCTAGKSRQPLEWFLDEIAASVVTGVDRSWIIPARDEQK